MPSKSIHIQLKNCCSETARLCGCLEAFAAENAVPPKVLKQINLAIEELFDNIVSYGFNDQGDHRIDIFVARRGDTITVRIEDDGRPFDPLAAKAPERSCSVEKCQIGGLGIYLAKKLMDLLSYRRKGNKNVVVMKKRIAAD